MLTVLLATRNRGRILADVLESFCHLRPPMSGWKLVVVDNGSTDETPQVLESFTDRLPLHALNEPKLGKNAALNAGLNWVEGDLAVFTDDDVFPHDDWLIELREAADTHPWYSMFGGAIVPRWETGPPAWISWVVESRYTDSKVNDIRGGPVYTITDPLLMDGPVAPELIFGPNMAIRTSVFRAGMRFDSCIGPRGSSYPMGSETELLLRLNRQGHKGWHVRKAVVEHLVREEQLEKAWILQRAIRFGRGQYRLSPPPKSWIGIPRHLFRDIPKEGLHLAATWLAFRKEELFRSRWRFNYLLGLAIEARNIKH
jgi:L-malate glycosyltransferase